MSRFWKSWYSSRKWRAIRERLLTRSPYCIYCLKRDGRVEAATVADHIIPHKGNKELFWDENNLQSLCKQCHDSDKAREESGSRVMIRFDASGYPVKGEGGE